MLDLLARKANRRTHPPPNQRAPPPSLVVDVPALVHGKTEFRCSFFRPRTNLSKTTKIADNREDFLVLLFKELAVCASDVWQWWSVTYYFYTEKPRGI